MRQGRRRRISPDELRRVRLRQIGFRKGYDPAAVDELLAHLADEMAERDREIAALSGRLDHVQRELYARRHGVLPDAAPISFDPAAIDAHVRAQRYAEELVATAQQSAAAIVDQGRAQAHNVMAHAQAAAERAARDYRARAGAGYTADREELVRLATLARWAMGQISGLRYQVDATDDAARSQLSTILDRLGPLLGEPGRAGEAHGHPGGAQDGPRGHATPPDRPGGQGGAFDRPAGPDSAFDGPAGRGAPYDRPAVPPP